jgi:hypothetical protein
MPDYEQWEYRVATFGSSWQGVKDEAIEAALNDMGAEGWEVVGTTYYPFQIKVVAKRPLTRAVRRQRSIGEDT